jgi:hypothetical protein
MGSPKDRSGTIRKGIDGDREDREDAFWRKLVLPEEERLANGTVWRGGYRWFRSPNIIPIERYRNKRKKPL